MSHIIAPLFQNAPPRVNRCHSSCKAAVNLSLETLHFRHHPDEIQRCSLHLGRFLLFLFLFFFEFLANFFVFSFCVFESEKFSMDIFSFDLMFEKNKHSRRTKKGLLYFKFSFLIFLLLFICIYILF